MDIYWLAAAVIEENGEEDETWSIVLWPLDWPSCISDDNAAHDDKGNAG